MRERSLLAPSYSWGPESQIAKLIGGKLCNELVTGPGVNVRAHAPAITVCCQSAKGGVGTSLIALIQMRSRGTERFSHLPKVTQLAGLSHLNPGIWSRC